MPASLGINAQTLRGQTIPPVLSHNTRAISPAPLSPGSNLEDYGLLTKKAPQHLVAALGPR